MLSRRRMLRRYACVRQTDLTDCGPAALATVALHHGVRLGREKLRDLAGTDRVGTNLLGMLQAGERLGFSVRAVKGPYEELPGVPLPAIAHVRTDEGLGHFVVLHRVRPRGVVVADPARGVEKLSRETFSARWTGYLLLLSPRVELRAAAGAPASPARRLAALLLRYRRILVEAFACALLMTLLGIASSYFVQHLVDSVLARREGRLLTALGTGMLAVVTFRALFGALRQYLMAYVGRQATLSLVAEYARHILRLPMRFFETREVGEILSRVQDAAKVRDAVSGVTLTAVVDGTMVILSMAVLWLHDARLALVSSLFVPALWLSALAHQPAARRRSREAMERAAKLSAHMVQDVAGIETVKALGLERARTEEGETRLVRVVQAVFSSQKLAVSAGAAAMLATGAAGIIVLWYGGLRVMDGAMSVGQLMFFNGLLAYMLQPLERLASVNLQIQDALVAVDRLDQVMDLTPELLDAEPRRAPLAGIRDGIELRDVSFQYGTRGKVLEKIALRIPVGKKVAILGESGSGKTTLLKLLLRFYDPTEGQVLLDGV
ncbi:MAG TPA: peptidase domain-containing ABC transporter, partial [Haliangiales bacterium]|nr:peptidase domain-containing ABC transporter [Haliangiales bacterium]